MEELIRKKDALDALMAERKRLLANGQKGAEHVLTHHGYNVIDELPTVQSGVPVTNVGDMISRQAAIDAVLDRMNIEKYGRNAKPEEIMWTLENLPPVQPKRGKWLPDNRCGGGYWVCSSCKYPTEAFAADVIYKYCPFCGADMRGEQE